MVCISTGILEFCNSGYGCGRRTVHPAAYSACAPSPSARIIVKANHSISYRASQLVRNREVIWSYKDCAIGWLACCLRAVTSTDGAASWGDPDVTFRQKVGMARFEENIAIGPAERVILRVPHCFGTAFASRSISREGNGPRPQSGCSVVFFILFARSDRLNVLCL